MHRRFFALQTVIVVIAVLACTSSVDRRITESIIEEAGDPGFMSVPEPHAAGAPGTIYRSEPIASIGDGMRAWRIIYHSTDLFGADVLVSGVVVAPDAPTPPGGRPIVSWGHPTTGAAVHCAPSLSIDPFDLIEGLDALVGAGYVVAATDYPGMGLPGPDAYLIGETEGNSVLDAARAARALPGTGANDQLLLWGHSQGGQAALFAAQDAASYAPELHLVAAAVAAPAADLAALLRDDIGTVSGITIGSYAFSAYASVYRERYPGLSLDSILSPEGVRQTAVLDELCLVSGHDELHGIAAKLLGTYVVNDPGTTEPWATMLRENTPGSVRIPAPLLVAQGLSDTLVHPTATAGFVRTECAIGTAVDSRTYPDTGHGLIALRAVPAVLDFFSAAFAGTTTSTC
ncbi:alpha/beta fold hydrolase [Plantibacter sp. YIM 135249]|uniref:alpha/beta fold hydrolase n=1 Tax=Plantibacter sp. YIM 135249 TaxID=3423918 RepID=UPI003D33B019